MKTNIVSMPHMMAAPGDICLMQSIVDAHPGNYWLYYWLPGTKREEAVRISPTQVPPPSIDRPRILKWNGSIQHPTIAEPLVDDAGNVWKLTAGVLIEQEGAQKKLAI